MNNTQDELPDDLHDRITQLSEKGNDLLDRGDAKGAVATWRSALTLLPEPHRKWDAAVWLYASIGDAERQDGNMDAALDAFHQAAASSDGYANSFVQLGIGTCLYDLGRQEESTEHLLRAYMGEGEEIFEESDPRYLAYLRDMKLIE